jgi:acetamidase/formamidase
MRYVSIAALLLCHISWVSAQQSIHFSATSYSNQFSSHPSPVLRIQQGDTVYTTSVDAVGMDQNGVRVAKRGNPLTGPFFIQGAEPGDVLAVTLVQVSLNRNFATTLNTLIPKVLPKSIGKKTWRSAKIIKWQLDLQNLKGSPTDTAMHLKHVTIPLHPFLGCVGIAPEGNQEIGSGASGLYGGNLDFRYNTTGATIYLPVFHQGALLYLGDGHAAQGDGELNGDALETSMSFSFTARVLKKSNFPLKVPMVENTDYLMFIGIESSLDKSLQAATEAMRTWLQDRYKLTLTEASQIIGPAIEYRIPKIAATKVELVALISKNILEQLGNNTNPITNDHQKQKTY